MKQQLFFISFVLFISGCGITAEKPSAEKMKDCLTNELMNKAIVEGFDQQDGLAREKDGVKYYEGYFNAEVKFIANSGVYSAGDRYKIIKGTLSFMKTEKGWNCQEFDWKSTSFVKINEGGGTIPNKNQAETSRTNNDQSTQGRFPSGSNKLLAPSDIAGYTKEDLKIMRNEIYARHGYIFSTNDMREYFSSQTWYQPRYDNVDDLLTAIEKSNIAFIKRFE